MNSLTRASATRNVDDYDPATGRLTREAWARLQREYRPSLHIDYDPIVKRTNEDPAANATAKEIKTLIEALEIHYAELGFKLNQLKLAHPLARMPDESARAYRKRVPQSDSLPVEERLLLVWPANQRTEVGRWIKALQKSQRLRDYGPYQHINQDETVRTLFEPFEKRWTRIYHAALHAEEERVRAIIEATPIDDDAWEKYQAQCDYNDARKEIEAALTAECEAKGGTIYSVYGRSWNDIVHERTNARAPEITRARHARMTQAAE